VIYGLTCNWFNQNIKSLSNVKFEIKSKTLNMFQIHKRWKKIIIKNIEIVVINLYDLKSFAYLNLQALVYY
jgi:hypothetical protein